MTIPQSILLSPSQAEQVLLTAREAKWIVGYSGEKHQLVIENGPDWIAKIYLPWTWNWNSQQGLFPLEDPHFSLTLIRAGQAAVGYFHQGKLLDHKVFRAYMVRQKQGKSQIKHLKTKGKSRAGSRIRLAETARFLKKSTNGFNPTLRSFPWIFGGSVVPKRCGPISFLLR